MKYIITYDITPYGGIFIETKISVVEARNELSALEAFWGSLTIPADTIDIGIKIREAQDRKGELVRRKADLEEEVIRITETIGEIEK